MEEVIQVLEAVIGARDPYTVYHQQRVAQLAWAIAGEIGLSHDRLRSLWVAATIHDLGKIAIPTEILNKSGRLTEVEFSIIKTHPQKGYDILKPMKFIGDVRQIILQHHERINGAGYPYGLAGADILLEAKILGVADVVEAMCSHRPYRPSLGLEKALNEISLKKGVLYDSAVVEACLKVCEEDGQDHQIFGIPSLTPSFEMSSHLSFGYATS